LSITFILSEQFMIFLIYFFHLSFQLLNIIL
jgi:hypothetical protein